eukprot:TRINITY_DN8415_c0_g2_i2.p1 TRINITY_DN8415_c0_g2~~TRINITY_DN8415_c0_g2_i2.p1  ORF type:complete len:264 (-),score=83.44 TRINITY_DN8415_c0_g2_i2:23-814(-)
MGVFFFFFKQKTAYEMQRGLVGSEMCIRDRSETIASLSLDIAKTFESLNNYDEAIKHQKNALSILSSMENTDNMILANISITLAGWLAIAKEYSEALEIMNNSLKLYEEVYGKDDMKTTKIREKLCDIFHKAGHLKEAISEMKKVEVSKRKLMGEKGLGLVYKKLGDWLYEDKGDEEAEIYTQKANKLLKKRKIRKSHLEEDSSKVGKLTLESASEREEGGSGKKSDHASKTEISNNTFHAWSKKGIQKPSSKKSKRLIIRKT